MWASDHGFEILGTRFRVQSQDQNTASEVDRLWAPFAVDSSAARLRNTFAIVADGELSLYRDCSGHTSGSPGSVVLRLLMEANRLTVAGYLGFAAHAAVVGTSERIAAVIGESGAGKSTLAAAAISAGLSYGSDEALCVDRSTDEVVAYPKPLGLSVGSQSLLGIEASDLYALTDEAPVLASELGGEILEGGRKLTDIVLPVRCPGEEPRFEPLNPSDAVAALLSNSFNHYQDPQGSYLLTARLAANARTWRFTYSDAMASGKALAAFLSER